MLTALDDETCWLSAGRTTVGVRPDRGALVSTLIVDDIDLLYLEEATLESPSGAVRGGVPLLFPFAGELTDGRLSATGTFLPRHGFGRLKRWRVARLRRDSITMRLDLDDEIRRAYPFEFDVSQIVTALPRGARIDLDVANGGRDPLPLAPGWHPYFPCPAGRKFERLRAWLPEVRESVPEPFECDVNVPAPAEGRLDVDLPDRGRVSLAWSDSFKTLEIWTPPQKNFVCIEPWVGPSNTINTGARVSVPPGGLLRFWMSIERAATR